MIISVLTTMSWTKTLTSMWQVNSCKTYDTTVLKIDSTSLGILFLLCKTSTWSWQSSPDLTRQEGTGNDRWNPLWHIGLRINASIVACHFNSKLIWNNFAKTTPSIYTYLIENMHSKYINIALVELKNDSYSIAWPSVVHRDALRLS